MAKLTTKQRDRMRATSFAYPERRLLPVHDAGHLHSSLGRFAQITYPDLATQKRVARRIARAAKKLRISLDPAGAVARMAAGVRGPQRQAKARRNPSDPTKAAGGRDLAAARRLAKEFHGTTRGQVVELSASERKPLGRYAVVVGKLDEMVYEPEAGSKRASSRWRHESGDRGPFAARSKEKPLLVVSPGSRRPQIVMDKSPMRLTKNGLEG